MTAESDCGRRSLFWLFVVIGGGLLMTGIASQMAMLWAVLKSSVDLATLPFIFTLFNTAVVGGSSLFVLLGR